MTDKQRTLLWMAGIAGAAVLFWLLPEILGRQVTSTLFSFDRMVVLLYLPVIIVMVVGAPVWFPIAILWSVFWALMGFSGSPYDAIPAWILLPVVFISGIFGWHFWGFCIGQTLRLFGVHDPFIDAYKTSRPWMMLAMVRIATWWEIRKKFGRGHTGGWASVWEVIAHPYRAGDLFIGRAYYGGLALLKPVGMETDKHVVILGSMGSGKTSGVLIPTLCVHPGSAVVVDIKGELATITANRRGPGNDRVRGMEQSLIVLDPAGITPVSKSWHYNPLEELAVIERVEGEDAAAGFAGKIIEGIGVSMAGNDPFWDIQSRSLEIGVLLFVHVYEDERTLMRFRELVVRGDEDTYAQGLEEGIVDENEDTPFDVLAARMQAAKDGPYGNLIANAGSALMTMPDRTRGSVLASMDAHSAWLDTPSIRRISERSDFCFRDLKRQAMTVYLCCPTEWLGQREMLWLRMLNILAMNAIVKYPDIRPKYPVLLAIDEFPALGKIDGLETLGPVMRSYGGRLLLIAQDKGQIERVWGPQTTNTFLGNAEAVQVLATDDAATIGWLSQTLGQSVVRKSLGRGMIAEGVHEILTPEQARRFLNRETGNQIVLRSGKRPMRAKVAPYFKYLPKWYYDPDPRYARGSS